MWDNHWSIISSVIHLYFYTHVCLQGVTMIEMTFVGNLCMSAKPFWHYHLDPYVYAFYLLYIENIETHGAVI